MEYQSNIKYKTLKKESIKFNNYIVEYFVDKNGSAQNTAKYYRNNKNLIIKNKNLFGIINFKNGQTYGISVNYK